MTRLASLLLAGFAFALAGCSTQPAKPWKPPAVVLILPPENMTQGSEVEQVVTPIVFEKLVNRGYYCISPELSRGIFHANKLEDAGRIHALPPAKFREIFGADAVLKVRVKEWSSYYVVLAAHVSVTFEMSLVDTETGEVLWTRTRTESKDPDAEPEGSQASLIGMLVKNAVHAAFTDYEPLAEENAEAMLSDVPRGNYTIGNPDR